MDSMPGIVSGSKIDVRQQFAAVGRRVFDRCGEPLPALAECSLLPGGHQARF